MRPADEAPAFAQATGHVTCYIRESYECQARAATGISDTLPVTNQSSLVRNPLGDRIPFARGRRMLSRAAVQLKHQAFNSNRRAKAEFSERARAAFYRRKAAAINALLRLGCASVDEVDWRHDDPLIGVWFLGGGRLHIPMSMVDLQAFKEVRAQLNGHLAPQRAPAA